MFSVKSGEDSKSKNTVTLLCGIRNIYFVYTSIVTMD